MTKNYAPPLHFFSEQGAPVPKTKRGTKKKTKGTEFYFLWFPSEMNTL